jgi:DNA-binding NtrC family response regulator
LWGSLSVLKVRLPVPLISTMSTHDRQLLLCISNPEAIRRIEAAAHELGILLLVEASPSAVLENLQLSKVDAVVIQFGEFGPEASCFIEKCRKQSPGTPVIALLQQFSSEETFRFAHCGVFNCLHLLSSENQLADAFQSAYSHVSQIRVVERTTATELWRQCLVGQSPSMEQVIKIIRLVASRRCTVLISGETGTGKEMAARALHLASDRAKRPMVAVNCSAIPENLIEAELFGHVKGAFTGAVNHRIGRFEQAHGGTLFLDEIGELPIDLQSKLLRVLQEREIQRLGNNETIKVDVRVIAATNANLLTLVRQGKFREDLYYRLNVVPIYMPALRERSSDIPLLVNHFIKKICEAEHLPLKQVSPEVFERLSSYVWPGNVRQLENVIEHAVILSGDRGSLYASDFSLSEGGPQQSSQPIHVPSRTVPAEGLNYTEALRQFELAILQQAMSKAQGNKTLAADILQLPRTTLIHKLRVLDYTPAL